MRPSSRHYAGSQAAREQIDRLVSRHRESMIDDLVRAIAIPSVNPARLERAEPGAGEAAFQEFFLELSAAKGLRASRRDGCGPDRNNVEVTIGSLGVRRSLLLNSHCDVVPATESGWDGEPFMPRRESNRIIGRGAADAKGSLIAMLEALWLVQQLVGDEIGETQLTSVVDEESGGGGTLAWIERRRAMGSEWPDAAIVGEPTSLNVSPATRGARSFRLRVKGKNAHAGEAYLGVNAVKLGMRYVEGLERLHEDASDEIDDEVWRAYPNSCIFNLGRVSGGKSFAAVASDCEIEGVVGWVGPMTLAAMSARVEERLARIAREHPWSREHPPELEWTLVGFEASRTPRTSHVVEGLLQSARLVRPGSQLRGLLAGTDMRLLVNDAGIPTVNFGPGQMAQGHSANEHLDIDEYLDAIRILASFIINWGMAPRKQVESAL
jgi:acetylornithine deacetylase